MKELIIGITGADGVCLGVRLLEMLRDIKGVATHLVMTRQAEANLRLEGCRSADAVRGMADHSHAIDDMAASIASGSFVTDGMIIAPCSMKTLGGITSGYSCDLLLRAADVCLKEGRKVVLVPREMPLGRLHLRNLLTASELGCMIVPPMLTFYNAPRSIRDLMDHVLAKALLPFGIFAPGFNPWRGTEQETEESRTEMRDAAPFGAPVVLHEGSGRTAVRLEARSIGPDLDVLLSGGSAHIGATALALPPDEDGVDGDAAKPCVRTLAVPGHRDDVPARALAARLCLAVKRPVCVTAGIHIDAASGEEIAVILRNAERACDRLAICLAPQSAPLRETP
ncbi:MAG: UbiX family flavin prenyltransferase [Desulfovibrio sp.]|nr:UbiX family flavin prenyltransferase [Desulfovibrio sp.]